MTEPWQCLATLRDLHEVGIPPQALAGKGAPEKRRTLLRASSLFVAKLRKRYEPPLAILLSDFTVTSAAGTATRSGDPTGGSSAADVRIEVVVGGTVSGGLVTIRVSRDDGLATTWLTTAALATTGLVTVDGVEVTLAGTWVAGEAVTYSAGPDPGVRASVAAWGAWLMLGNRGVDPKTAETLKGQYDMAASYARELAKGEEAELASNADSTPERSEGGPLFLEHTRSGFLTGEL